MEQRPYQPEFETQDLTATIRPTELRTIGWRRKGVLQRSFPRDRQYYDQLVWSILDDDWLQAKAVWGPKCH